MNRNLFEIKYFETYYFANVIKNTLDEPFAYLRKLEEFFGENNESYFSKPFPKVSRLHDFIIWSIDAIWYEGMEEIEHVQHGGELWIDIAIKHYQIDGDNFHSYLNRLNKDSMVATEDDIYEYYQDLRESQMYEILLTRISEEVFFILFLNRQLLQNFNKMASLPISLYCLGMGDKEADRYFKKDGVLKRVNIPAWVKKAAFHRDRGMCTNCHKDITGLVSIGRDKNFDHIISLEEGGLNDVTNIQLLCEACNKAKSKRHESSSPVYEKWF